MFYQLRVNAFFETAAPLTDILAKLEMQKSRMMVINPGLANQEYSVIDEIECRHDECPTAPCTAVRHWDNSPCNLEPEVPG